MPCQHSQCAYDTSEGRAAPLVRATGASNTVVAALHRNSAVADASQVPMKIVRVPPGGVKPLTPLHDRPEPHVRDRQFWNNGYGPEAITQLLP